jgi:penicillin-binding protein A
VNRQIVKLFAFTVVLFGVLVGFTSYWAVFDAENLKGKDANKRPLFEQQQIERGRILTADGVVIARSIPKGKGASLRYVRRYPEGSLYSHPVGYSFVTQGDTEFEEFHNDELVGNDSEFASILDELRGAEQEGNDVVTNIDSEAQQVAMSALQSPEAGSGAVVAIEPDTGRVRVMASNPPYDPNLVPEHLGRLNKDPTEALVNRATQGLYPPGSTFKVVTAAAALDADLISPDTPIDAPSSLEIQGQPLENDYGIAYPGLTLDDALTNSVNTWFAQVGEKVGQDTLFETMGQFGFSSKPAIDLPSEQMSTSGLYDIENDRILDSDDPIDIARVAIGQERLLVTPLQMAEVAAAVANGGSLMKPQIWNRVVDPDGRVVESLDPSEYGQPIDEETAAELTVAMEGVVERGTGTNARISGISVAGKTGTAETPGNETCGGGVDQNQAWFIGFAPADDPQIAIAATVECTLQFGGDVAAPIFREVAESLLDE